MSVYGALFIATILHYRPTSIDEPFADIRLPVRAPIISGQGTYIRTRLTMYRRPDARSAAHLSYRVVKLWIGCRLIIRYQNTASLPGTGFPVLSAISRSSDIPRKTMLGPRRTL